MSATLTFDLDVRFKSQDPDVVYPCEVEGCREMTDGGLVHRRGEGGIAVYICDHHLFTGLQRQQGEHL
jgi:hypothetical protein